MSEASIDVRWKMPFSELAMSLRRLGLPGPVMDKLRAMFLAGVNRGTLKYSDYCPLQYAVDDYSSRLACCQPAGPHEALLGQLTCAQCKCVAVLRAVIAHPEGVYLQELDAWLTAGLDVCGRVSRAIDVFLSEPLPEDQTSTRCRQILARPLEHVVAGLWPQRSTRMELDKLDWAQIASTASEIMRRRSVRGSFDTVRQSRHNAGRTLDESWLMFLLYGVHPDIEALLKMPRKSDEERDAADRELRRWGFEPTGSLNRGRDEDEWEVPLADGRLPDAGGLEHDICEDGCAARANGVCGVRLGRDAKETCLPCFLDWADFYDRLDARNAELGELPQVPTLRPLGDVVSQQLGKWLTIFSVTRRDEANSSLFSLGQNSTKSRYERLMEILRSSPDEK